MKYPRQGPQVHKLFLLYALRALHPLPLTFTQLERIAVGSDHMDYFSLKQALSALLEDGLVRSQASLAGDAHLITDEGGSLLAQFQKEIPASMRGWIDRFARDNRESLVRSSHYIADYSKIAEGQYMVCCRAVEGGLHLMEININVATREQAEIVCAKWVEHAPAVYAAIMEKLT